MQNNIEVNGFKYEVIKNVGDSFNLEEFTYLYTEYFQAYDYIFGDYSYDKLRLKGFCDKKNKIFNDINNIEGLDSYIDEYCSYKANYFLLKKI